MSSQGIVVPTGTRDFFVYSASFLPLNANATQQANVPIQADSQFVIMEITGDVRVLVSDEVVIAAPAIRVTLRDQGTGRILMDAAQEWPNMVGTAQRPFFLPAPKLLQANSTLLVELTSDAAAARNVRISFIGYKVFPG